MRAFCGSIVAIALVFSSVRASAQDEENRAAARVLFEEGVTFVDTEQWEDAVDRFRRALELYDSAVVRFNLAHALTELAELVEAADLLRQVILQSDAQEEVHDAARERLVALEPRLAHLTIRAEGGEAEITRDGVPVPAAALGVATPSDPGAHEIVATRDEEVVATESVELAEGERREVLLTIPEPVIVPPIEAPPPPPPPTPFYEEWWFWTIIGGVVVAAGLGIGLGIGLTQDDACLGDFTPCRIDL